MTQIHSPSPNEHNSFIGRPINGSLLLTISEAAAATSHLALNQGARTVEHRGGTR